MNHFSPGGRGPTLDHLPPEICHLIFSDACIDGGITARSLALTSKYIRGASESSRFHSVSVSGLDQMLNLLAHLEAGTPESRRVSHMYMSYVAPSKLSEDLTIFRDPRLWTRRFNVGEMSGSQIIQECYDDRMARYEPPPATLAAIHAAAAAILTIASSTLITLTLVMPQTKSFLLPPDPLPALEELSLYCINSEECLWKPSADYRLPSLRKLHLAGSDFTNKQVRTLLKISPGLTHLRLSEVEGSTNVDGALWGAVKGLTNKEGFESPGRHHPSLRTIIIQYVPPPPQFAAGGLNQFFATLLHGFHRLCNDKVSVEAVLLPSRVLGAGELDDVGKAFWKNRMAGGDGCWDVSTRVDVSHWVR
ncbi:hypothetical protein JAAARDRAFT_43014 [Jaapia argillacea MUCL 33604]|uniref:F-box domain-containing protein n=1 Tax=Jaapia argillacea MUCL 33604 TaxID=933084 RepID=A0A067P5V7_9AGAM|nr:hypothetical protein JAAARDRAFT_43014 [Jaapia argillacea MUCL 33604]